MQDLPAALSDPVIPAPNRHPGATRELLALLGRHRRLTWEMAKSELSERHSGQALGALWSLIHPLLHIGLYVLVFGFVLRPVLGSPGSFPPDYAAYLLSGLIPWISLQDALNKSTAAIHSHASLVRQVVFPIEILPVKGVVVTVIAQLVSLSLLAGYLLVGPHGVAWTIVLVPVLVAGQFALMTGLALALSAAGAYFRDLKDIVQILALAGLYCSPVLYPPGALPGLLEPMIHANPFSYMVWCYQDALYFGAVRHPASWVIFAALSLLGLSAGYRLFRRAKLLIGNYV